ncbi:hypothetical protein BHM03_00024244 [Ensete ventricosum]|nr:hypothetical protein BHM03_00024244 [Ensete ventricosum]
MASSSSLHAAPAAAPQVYAAAAASSSSSRRRPTAVSFPLPSKSKKHLLVPAKVLSSQFPMPFPLDISPVLDLGRFSNKKASLASPIWFPLLEDLPMMLRLLRSKRKLQDPKGRMLVDSRDIVELQLKQNDCELIIRKKEALPQPPAPAPIVMQAPAAPAYIPSEVPLPPAARALPLPAAASLAAPPGAASAPKASKSSHPPLKSPMAGTLYRSPGPDLPPFVKVIKSLE